MNTLRLRLATLAVASIVQLSAPASGPVEPVASDQNEALPKQAAARLGTIRFRHGGEITSLAVSNDGKYLASGSRDGSARVWETASGKLLRAISCETVQPAGVGFSADGKELLTGIDGEHLQLFEWASAKVPRTIDVALPTALVWSSDGKWIGCEVSGDESVQIHDPLSGKLCFGVKKANRLAFTADGKQCAVAQLGGAIKLLALPDGAELKTLPSPEESGNILDMHFNSDGRYLVAAHQMGLVAVWDVETAKRLHAIRTSGPVAFVPGQPQFAAVDRGHLVIFDLKTGERKMRVAAALNEAPFVFLPDGDRVAVAGPGNRVRIWNITTGAEVSFGDGHDAEVMAIAFTADGKQLLSGGDDGLRLWDVATFRERPAGKRSVPVQALSISPSKKSFVASDRGAINVWAPLHFENDKPYAERPTLVIPTTIDRAVVLVHSPDGNRIVFAGADKKLVFAEPRRGTIFQGLDLPADALAAAFDPTGRRLAIQTRDGWLRHWLISPRDGRESQDMQTWTRRVQRGPRGAVAYSPNGMLVAVFSGGRVVLFDSTTGREWQGFNREFGDGNVQALAFSPSGQHIAAGHAGPDGFVRIWEVATGKVAATLRSHAGGVNAIAFAPDGKLIASAGADSTILVWNLELAPSAEGRPLTLAEAWDALDDLDVKKSCLAMNALIDAGQKSISVMQEGAAEAVKNDARLRGWIRDLDADEFRIRKSARAALEKQGPRALPLLHAALDKKLPIDAERQIRLILDDFETHDIRLPESGLFGEPLRTVRSIRILEHIGGPDAVKLLEQWAESKDQTRIAAEAKSALEYIRR